MTHSIEFGKFAGNTLEWFFFNQPGFIEYMVEHGISLRDPGADARLSDLISRASSLAIPASCWCGRDVTSMLLTRSHSVRIGRVDFACGTCGRGARVTAVRPSFLVTRTFHDYDKAGARDVVRAIKRAYFQNPGQRMTQQRMERFFETPAHFL